MTVLAWMPGVWELVILIPFLLWLWVLIDILKSNFVNSSNKIIWLLAVIFLPFFGVILYFFMGKGQKVK